MKTLLQAGLDGQAPAPPVPRREAMNREGGGLSAAQPPPMLGEQCPVFAQMIREAQQAGYYPFFHPVRWGEGAEVEVEGRRLIMVGSNDYLGLARDSRVIEAAVAAARAYGTSHGGSRFLCGNTALHEELEERLADWVGKKKALVHATGYQTNLGILGALSAGTDWILSDHENHASLLEGARNSGVRQAWYRTRDAAAAARKVAAIRRRHAGARIVVATDSLFSMSGEVAPLAELAALKAADPRMMLFVDEAHGLGVLGPGGRGAVAEAGVTAATDIVMGTFSKALASIGGFVASDDEDLVLYLKHHSQSLIFSAALPAMNAAAVLAALDVLQAEPERLDRLRTVVRRARAAYRQMGLPIPAAETPILPIPAGDDVRACQLARALFERGVFAMPALFPAVPRGHALVRTAYMSAHTDRQLDQVFDALADVFRATGPSDGPSLSSRDVSHVGGG